MTPEQLLSERAQLLLGEAARQNKGPSFHHLDEIAATALPDLSAEDRRAAVMAATRYVNQMERVAPPPGYKPSQKRNGAALEQKRETGEHGKVVRFGVGPLKEAIEKELTKDRELRNRELRERVEATGVRKVAPGTFDYHAANIRKKLGISIPRGPRAVAPSNDRQVGVAAQENGKAPAKPAADIQKSTARASGELVAQENPTAPPPPVAVGIGDAPLPHASATITNADGPTLPATSRLVTHAPGIIELGGGEDSFKATRRQDGGWDVELRAQVDTEVMDMLAGVIYRRVVGRAMEARA